MSNEAQAPQLWGPCSSPGATTREATTERSPHTTPRESPHTATKTQHSPKIMNEWTHFLKKGILLCKIAPGLGQWCCSRRGDSWPRSHPAGPQSWCHSPATLTPAVWQDTTLPKETAEVTHGPWWFISRVDLTQLSDTQLLIRLLLGASVRGPGRGQQME